MLNVKVIKGQLNRQSYRKRVFEEKWRKSHLIFLIMKFLWGHKTFLIRLCGVLANACRETG
jgi:hypothetical protein